MFDFEALASKKKGIVSDDKRVAYLITAFRRLVYIFSQSLRNYGIFKSIFIA